MAAYLLILSGGSMDKLKLAKMLYLVERTAIGRWGDPLFKDRYFSLKHGPVCTGTLSGLDGESDEEVWTSYVQRSGNKIAAREGLDGSAFGRLSEAAIELANDVHDEVGGMSTTQIRDYAHALPENRHTTSKRIPISDEVIAREVGLRDPVAYAEKMTSFREAAIGAKRP